MRLPTPVYETLPWLYGLIGALLLWEGYRLHTGSWSTTITVVGFLGVILGAMVWLRRRDYRATRGDYIDRGDDPLR